MTIRDELLALKGRSALITAESIVDWARDNPSSDLHRALEWDNDVAAEQHRIWQARRLIAIHVISEEGDRTFVSLSIDRQRDGGGYRGLDDVIRKQSLRDVLLEDALQELERVRQKYERLQELAGVWAEIKKTRSNRPRKEEQRASA